jgi:hypothetical protein
MNQPKSQAKHHQSHRLMGYGQACGNSEKQRQNPQNHLDENRSR